MIQISKDEASLLRKRIKNVSISKTMKKDSKRGKYYVEPTRKVIKMLKQIRDVDHIEV